MNQIPHLRCIIDLSSERQLGLSAIPNKVEICQTARDLVAKLPASYTRYCLAVTLTS